MNRILTKAENAVTMHMMRVAYMAGNLTHQEYYLWLADFVGATPTMLPVSTDTIRQSVDPHFNDIALSRWDRCDRAIRCLAYAQGLPWSLSDTVCVLKALAWVIRNNGEKG